MKSYKFLANKGSFIKTGMVQKLSDEKASSLLKKGIVELVEEEKPKTKLKSEKKTIKLTNGE